MTKVSGLVRAPVLLLAALLSTVPVAEVSHISGLPVPLGGVIVYLDPTIIRPINYTIGHLDDVPACQLVKVLSSGNNLPPFS